MISNVYIIACDTCRKNMQILKANSIGTAFKAARKLPWKNNNNNTEHMCPACMAKIDNAEKKESAPGCEVTAGDVSQKGG